MQNKSRQFVSRLLGLTLAVVALVAPSVALAATVDQPQGEVWLHKAGTAEDLWTAVMGTEQLSDGDSVKTQNGTCTLTYSDEASFQVQNNTVFVVKETATSQDIALASGWLKGKVNKEKATKTFQVVTPTAVAAVRGTEVDFGFNENGELTVDLHNGSILVYNEDEDKKMEIPVSGSKKIIVTYDKETGVIKVKNECSSDGKIEFNVLGTTYAENPCEEVTINLETASGTDGPPSVDGSGDDSETLDETDDNSSNDDSVPPPVSGDGQ